MNGLKEDIRSSINNHKQIKKSTILAFLYTLIIKHCYKKAIYDLKNTLYTWGKLMSFGYGLYTGLSIGLGMPYVGGMGFGCCNPFYNPFSFCQNPGWYTLNNYLQPNLLLNNSPLCFNTFTPYLPSFSPIMPVQNFSFTPNTINIGFSASEMLKSGGETASKTDTTQQSSPSPSSTPSRTTNNEQKQTNTVSSPFDGDNEEAGKRLAELALKNSDEFHNQCSTHVNNAISEANLGDNTNCDANQMFDQMRSNPNFKEIPATTDTTSLKAGTVLIYDKGVSGYGDWGHIEIALGDGRAVSDGITEKIKPNPSALFIPVSA